MNPSCCCTGSESLSFSSPLPPELEPPPVVSATLHLSGDEKDAALPVGLLGPPLAPVLWLAVAVPRVVTAICSWLVSNLLNIDRPSNTMVTGAPTTPNFARSRDASPCNDKSSGAVWFHGMPAGKETPCSSRGGNTNEFIACSGDTATDTSDSELPPPVPVAPRRRFLPPGLGSGSLLLPPPEGAPAGAAAPGGAAA